MKKIFGLALIVSGIVIIVFSIFVLVMAFDIFIKMGSSSEDIVYTLGSIVFPLILTVLGRWIYRKGVELFKIEAEKR